MQLGRLSQYIYSLRAVSYTHLDVYKRQVLSYKDGDIVKQVMARTDGIGADSVIICGGNDEVFAQAIDMVRYGIGTVSNVNYFGGTGTVSYTHLF